MLGQRAWTFVPGVIIVAAAVVALAGYTASLQGAQQGTPPSATPASATPAPTNQPVIDGLKPGQPGYATLLANLEVVGKAPTGPWAYSGSSNFNRYFVGVSRSPVQPVKFPHPVHVNTLKMNCVFCHFAADKSPDPGMPAVGTCMGCHTTGPATRPEIKILKTFADSGRAIPWIRIHKVPEYVHFPHVQHVNAGVTCQSCHGQIQNMPQVTRYASLNMGWCVRCHVNGYSRAEGMRAAGYQPSAEDLSAPVRKARYDCSSCHY